MPYPCIILIIGICSAPVENDLPPNWTSAVDPDTGDTYYANIVTGETTWDHPLSIRQAEEEEAVSITACDVIFGFFSDTPKVFVLSNANLSRFPYFVDY